MSMQGVQSANFFWHGDKLPLWNYKCVESFVRNGFSATVWTYNSLLEIPPGCTRADASSIVDESNLKSITQNGKQGCLSAFSDLFRWSFLEKNSGWWFDTDCFCLKHESEFTKLLDGGPIIAGLEPSPGEDLIATAILNVPNKDVARMIKLLIDKTLEITNRNIGWAQISVQMLTDLVKRTPPLALGILDKSYFCPVSPQEATKAINPAYTKELEDATSNAYTYHFWNEMMRRAGVDCGVMPPEGSYLYNKFSS